MINANKTLHAKAKYDRTLTVDEAKKRLKYLGLDGRESDLEAYFAILAVCLEKEGFKDKELINKLMDIKKMTEFKELLNRRVAEILQDSRVNVDAKSIQGYIGKNIYPYYKFEFRKEKSRELSFLPLDLRLFIYNHLLQLEEERLTSIHYLDRMETTLAKIGEKNLATVIAGFKWVLNWGVVINGNADEVFKEDIEFINDAKEIRIKKLKMDGINAGGYLEEVLYSISGFAYLENIHDKKMAKILIPLLKIYYKDFNDIDKYVKDLEIYITTHEEEKVKDIRIVVEKRKGIAANQTGVKEEVVEELKNSHFLTENNIKETAMFKIDTKARAVIGCIQGKIPLDSRYNEKSRKYKVKFDYNQCLVCEQFKLCPVSLVKEGQYVKISKSESNKKQMNKKSLIMTPEEIKNDIKNRVKNEGIKGGFFSIVRDNAVHINKQLKQSVDTDIPKTKLLQFSTGETVSMLKKYNMFETFSTLFNMEFTKKSGKPVLIDEVYMKLQDIIVQVINESKGN